MKAGWLSVTSGHDVGLVLTRLVRNLDKPVQGFLFDTDSPSGSVNRQVSTATLYGKVCNEWMMKSCIFSSAPTVYFSVVTSCTHELFYVLWLKGVTFVSSGECTSYILLHFKLIIIKIY